MTRSLVIGGTLFIGRALVEQLLDRGDEVVIMHRGQGTPYGDRVGEIRCDRNDVPGVRAALEHQAFDVVYDNVYDWQRGTTGEMVVAAARAASTGGRLRRYVFTSSMAVYGQGFDHDEDDPLVPASHPFPYYGQKAETERMLFRLGREESIPVTTIRPGFIYGSHNPFQREAWFWDRILADRVVIVPGDGTTPIQFVHVSDVARAALLGAQTDVAVGRAYNLACHPPLTHASWVQLLAQTAGKSVRTVCVPRPRLEAAGGTAHTPPFYFGEFLDPPPITVRIARAQAELGWDPRPLEEGFRDTFEWYRKQDRPRPDFSWENRVLAAI